jgi:hypothetical protein
LDSWLFLADEVSTAERLVREINACFSEGLLIVWLNCGRMVLGPEIVRAWIFPFAVQLVAANRLLCRLSGVEQKPFPGALDDRRPAMLVGRTPKSRLGAYAVDH